MAISLMNVLNRNSEAVLHCAICGYDDPPRGVNRFLQTAVENPGPALTAHSYQLGELTNDFPFIERCRVIPFFEKHLEDNLQDKKLAEKFLDKVQNLYPKSAKTRMALAYWGAVRSDDRVTLNELGKSAHTLHKATGYERFRAGLSKNIQELKDILYSGIELRQLRKDAVEFISTKVFRIIR